MYYGVLYSTLVETVFSSGLRGELGIELCAADGIGGWRFSGSGEAGIWQKGLANESRGMRRS